MPIPNNAPMGLCNGLEGPPAKRQWKRQSAWESAAVDCGSRAAASRFPPIAGQNEMTVPAGHIPPPSGIGIWDPYRQRKI
jgi:hypothetical protein